MAHRPIIAKGLKPPPQMALDGPARLRQTPAFDDPRLPASHRD